MPSRSKKKCGKFVCKLPVSGSEYIFDPVPWSTPVGIKNSNCYSFSLGDYSENRPVKATPGAYAALRGNKRFAKELDNLSCPSLTRRVIADNPTGIYKAKAEVPCKQGYFKIMMFVTKKGSKRGDFHFYSQFKNVKYPVQTGDTVKSIAHKFQVPVTNVYWKGGNVAFVKDANVFGQKLGHATGALLTDSCSKVIFDPRAACRGSGDLQYKVLCGSFCAAKGRVKSI